MMIVYDHHHIHHLHIIIKNYALIQLLKNTRLARKLVYRRRIIYHGTEVNFPCTNHPCDHSLQNTSRGASSLAPQWWLKASTAVKPIQYVHLILFQQVLSAMASHRRHSFYASCPAARQFHSIFLSSQENGEERNGAVLKLQFLQVQPVSMQHSRVWPDFFASWSARTCIECLSAKLGRREHKSNRPCIIQAPSSMRPYKDVKETRNQHWLHLLRWSSASRWTPFQSYSHWNRHRLGDHHSCCDPHWSQFHLAQKVCSHPLQSVSLDVVEQAPRHQEPTNFSYHIQHNRIN